MGAARMGIGGMAKLLAGGLRHPFWRKGMMGATKKVGMHGLGRATFVTASALISGPLAVGRGASWASKKTGLTRLGKGIGSPFKHPMRATALGSFALGGYGVAKGIKYGMDAIQPPPSAPPRRNMPSGGPGFNIYAKPRRMSNMGTDGLGLALHKRRHS